MGCGASSSRPPASAAKYRAADDPPTWPADMPRGQPAEPRLANIPERDSECESNTTTPPTSFTRAASTRSSPPANHDRNILRVLSSSTLIGDERVEGIAADLS